MMDGRKVACIALAATLILSLTAFGKRVGLVRRAPRAEISVISDAAPPRPGLVLLRARTTGEVLDKLAHLAMEISAESFTKEEQRVLLFTSDVAITDWKVKGPSFLGRAYVRRSGQDVELVVQGEGKCTIRLEFVANVAEERLGHKVSLPVVRALAAETLLSVPGADLEFTSEPRASMETRVKDGATVVTLYGGADRVSLSWKPKVPEKVLKPIVFADQTMRVRIGRGVMRMDSILDYSIVQGSVKELLIRLPADCSLLNIEGTDIRTWDIEPGAENAPRILKVSLLGEVKRSYRVSLTLEKVLPGVSLEVTPPAVEPLNVVREKGRIAVSAAKGISVETVALENASHVDVREMALLPRVPGEEIRLGFRYIKRPFTVKLRTGEVVAKTSVEVLTLIRAGMDSMRLTSTLNYTIRDAGVFQFRVRLGDGLKLIDINGENINNWQLDEAGRVLSVSLRSKAEGRYVLQIETEIEKHTGESAAVPSVHALDADRETGYIAVLAAPGMKVETAGLSGISQIDVKELPRDLLRASPALAYRYIRTDYELAVNISEIEPEVHAEVHTVATLDEHELGLDTRIHYTIRRAGIFQLRVAIPADLRRTNIEGEDIDDHSWDEKSGILTINLRSKVTGTYVLRIVTEKTLKDIEKGVDLPVVSAVGVKKERGFIGVVTKASVRVKPSPDRMTGLDDISISDLPPEMLKQARNISLAFKYFTQPWTLALAVERIKPRVTAECFNLLAIGERLVTVSATVKYRILHAGVDTLVLELPPAATAVDIDGDSIKHREQGKGDEENRWTITLQSKRGETYTLFVSFQQKLADNQSVVPYSGVRAMGVHRETGYLAVTSRPDVEMTVGPNDTDNLTPIDRREIPAEYMQGVTLPVLLAYRYVSQPYQIRVTTAPHDAAEVTVAVIETARLSTTVTEEGNMITDLVAVLRNSRQQYLDLKLPDNARIWHTFVAGEPVTPLVDGRVTKIPVARAAGNNEPFDVRLRYSHERDDLGRVGAIVLESPMKGIDIMRLGWTLSLPDGYDLIRDKGNIKRLDSVYRMERLLQTLNPDTEVHVRIRRRAASSAKMSRQYTANLKAFAQIEASRGQQGKRTRSIYTGSKPLLSNTFIFQSLIVSSKESARVEVQYLKGSIGIPLTGVIVLLVIGFSGLVWKWPGRRRFAKVAFLYGCSLIFLALRTLGEGAYRTYLTTIIVTLAVVASLLLVAAVVHWAGEALRRHKARRVARYAEGMARASKPAEEKPRPAPKAEAETDSDTGSATDDQ